MRIKKSVFTMLSAAILLGGTLGITGTDVFASGENQDIETLDIEVGNNITPLREDEIGVTVANTITSFTDVTEKSYAFKSIMYLASEGIIQGYGNGKYGLKDNVTRGQVAALVSRNLKLDTDKAVKDPYKDVKGDLHADDILAVTEAGYMGGKGNGVFDPKGILKRAEMAEVLTKVFDLKVKSTGDFGDMKKDHWAADSVRALYSNGITLGKGDNKFAPAGKVTREQYAEFLYRGIHLDPDFEAEPLPDPKPEPENPKPDSKPGVPGKPVSPVPEGATITDSGPDFAQYSYNKSLPGGGKITEVLISIPDYGGMSVLVEGIDNAGKSFIGSKNTQSRGIGYMFNYPVFGNIDFLEIDVAANQFLAAYGIK